MVSFAHNFNFENIQKGRTRRSSTRVHGERLAELQQARAEDQPPNVKAPRMPSESLPVALWEVESNWLKEGITKLGEYGLM